MICWFVLDDTCGNAGKVLNGFFGIFGFASSRFSTFETIKFYSCLDVLIF